MSSFICCFIQPPPCFLNYNNKRLTYQDRKVTTCLKYLAEYMLLSAWKVIRIRKLKYGQNITQKTKDWATRTLLKIGGELRCFGRVSSFCSTSDTRRVNLVTNPVINHETPFWSIHHQAQIQNNQSEAKQHAFAIWSHHQCIRKKSNYKMQQDNVSEWSNISTRGFSGTIKNLWYSKNFTQQCITVNVINCKQNILHDNALPK
jgi:hypothetical protein